MVDIGTGAQREIFDVHLSQYACYLIIQNGELSKPVIANGMDSSTLLFKLWLKKGNY